MVNLSRFVDFYRDQGLAKSINQGTALIYGRYLRPLLPKTNVNIIYNDVVVGKERLFERYIPNQFQNYTPYPGNDSYEQSYVRAIREHLEGTKVVVIGGGEGVSTVTAARLVGEKGRVISYEGGKKSAKAVRQTIDYNNVQDCVDVHHALVGKYSHVRGSVKEADVVDPEDLPPCDSLLLDCDGAELSILPELEYLPPLIIVEHHAVKPDIPYQPDSLREYFVDNGYDIVDEVVDNFGGEHPVGFGEEQTIFVAKRQGN